MAREHLTVLEGGDDLRRAALGLLTGEQAAVMLGIGASGLRNLVARGDLVPTNPGRRPSIFRLVEVAELKQRRRTPEDRARLAALAQRWTSSEDCGTMSHAEPCPPAPDFTAGASSCQEA